MVMFLLIYITLCSQYSRCVSLFTAKVFNLCDVSMRFIGNTFFGDVRMSDGIDVMKTEDYLYPSCLGLQVYQISLLQNWRIYIRRLVNVYHDYQVCAFVCACVSVRSGMWEGPILCTNFGQT